MGLLLIGGLISGIGLNAQVFPTLNPGIITVVVPYPGATPSEVEEAITRRVEEAVLGIEGVDEVRSSAAENVGTVTIELKDYVDDKEVKDDVESAVERIADFPPENAEQPEIERAQTVSDVMTLVVTSERDEMTLRQAAESLADQLLTLPSVTLVSLMGARDLEISVEVSEQTLREFNLSIADLARAINASSLNLSAGELRTDAGDLLLRTNQKRLRGPEFADIVLRAEPDGSILRLGDVATIRDGFVDEDVIQKFNGQQSLLVKVEKSEAEDALFIAAQLKAFLGSYQAPAGTSVEIWDDQTNILEQRLSLLVRNGLLGFALVFLFLVVMLDLRLATWVAMGVPISFLGAILFFAPFGVNINMISLFALIIVLGIVVDDAVVVGENIITEQEKHGLNPTATLRGIRGSFQPGVHRRADDHGGICPPALRDRYVRTDSWLCSHRGDPSAEHVAAGSVLHIASTPVARPVLEHGPTQKLAGRSKPQGYVFSRSRIPPERLLDRTSPLLCFALRYLFSGRRSRHGFQWCCALHLFPCLGIRHHSGQSHLSGGDTLSHDRTGGQSNH